MSYNILFDKQFIELGDGRCVPVLLEGCSSGTSFNDRTGKWQMDRSWEARPHLTGGSFAGTLQEMQLVAQAYRDEEKARYEKNGEGWDDDSWGCSKGYYHKGQRNMTFRSYLNMFKVGCKKALTVEQLATAGVRVKVSTGYKAQQRGIKPFTTYYSTTVQLLDFVKSYTINDCVFLTLTGLNEDVMKKIKSRFFPVVKKPKERVDVLDYFKVYIKDVGFFIRFLKNGYKYTENGSFGHKFIKKGDALKCIDRVNREFSNDIVELKGYINGRLV
jgi:hypothetical protein